MNFIKTTLLGLFAASMAAQGATGYKLQTRYPIAGSGGWDYITIDAAARRLYVSHATQVEVLNADSGQFIGTIADTPGVHGIAIVPAFKHGFTTNGREDKVSVFDPTDLHLIKKIDVGSKPDGIYYDPATRRVFTNNHGSHDVTAIDARTAEVVGTVKVEADGEGAVIGRDGLVYLNCENTSEVVVFDPKSLAVKHRYPIGVAETPTGLAYDPTTDRLFIGCRKDPRMVVMDAANGKVIGSYPIGAGVDYAAFDPAAKLVFFSNGDGTLSIFHEKSGEQYEDAGTVQTTRGAKTMALDPTTKRIFLPAAEYIEAPAKEGAKVPQRRIKPESFAVLVVGK